MKQLLLFSTLLLFFLSPILGFSQTYQVDVMRSYNWDEFAMPEDWQQSTTEYYTYGNGGNKETYIIAKSFPAEMNQYQYTKTYNGNNDILTSTRQNWDGLAWENSSLETYTYYTGTSNIKDLTYYDYSQGYDIFKIMYNDYDGTDFAEIIYQNGDSGGLVNSTRYEYTYNSPGEPATEIESEWIGGAWQSKEKSFATYPSGQRILDVYTYVGGVLGTEPFDRYITNYSGALEEEYIWQSWNGSGWDNNDIEISEYVNGNKEVYTLADWDSGAGDWAPFFKEERDYSVAAPLSTESFETESIKVFPNPATNIINISSELPIDRMELYDMVGKKVLISSNEKQLNVEGLKSGMYLLKVFSNDRSATKRVVIK